jgi:hypothetical protein
MARECRRPVPDRLTTAPAAAPAATSTPASRPRPGQTFTTVQRIIIAVVVVLVLVISGIGFAGSYTAVTHLAEQKGFGKFAKVFPIGVDSGIGAFLALDLLLTWLRIPFPLLRYGAWALTSATIAFNAAAAWPDPLGVGMHGVIPLLFVIAVEAARHAVGRIADITADKHIELPPVKRWMVAPWPTFRLWRRQIMWQIRSYDDAIVCERQAQVFRARLRAEHGRRWRRTARPEQILALRLATRGGLTIAEALALPEDEARAQKAAAQERQRLVAAEAAEQARREREEDEAAERAALARRAEAEHAERQRQIADAETAARLAEIQRQQDQAAAETERQHHAEQLAHAQQLAALEEQRRRAAAATAEAALRQADAERQARLEAERAANARTASASANGAATGSPRRPASGSPAIASAGSQPRANRPATASASDGLITTEEVVAAYQQLTTELSKSPSDAALGERLGVSRSRAQQLRTAAIEAGHTELAKALRVA